MRSVKLGQPSKKGQLNVKTSRPTLAGKKNISVNVMHRVMKKTNHSRKSEKKLGKKPSKRVHE